MIKQTSFVSLYYSYPLSVYIYFLLVSFQILALLDTRIFTQEAWPSRRKFRVHSGGMIKIGYLRSVGAKCMNEKLGNTTL